MSLSLPTVHCGADSTGHSATSYTSAIRSSCKANCIECSAMTFELAPHNLGSSSHLLTPPRTPPHCIAFRMAQLVVMKCRHTLAHVSQRWSFSPAISSAMHTLLACAFALQASVTDAVKVLCWHNSRSTKLSRCRHNAHVSHLSWPSNAHASPEQTQSGVL